MKSFFTTSHIPKILAFVFGVVALVILMSSPPRVLSSGNAITGWAWSNNIGWVSLTGGTGHNDGISFGAADGSGNYPISGYAWSDAIGWIQFGNSLDISSLAGLCTGSIQCVQAKIVPNVSGVSAKVVGWAKALSADNNGWNGWIYLGDTSHNDGINIDDSGNMTGQTWGGDNVGWLGFNSGFNTAVVTPPCAGSVGSVCSGLTAINTTHPWCQVTTTSCTVDQQCAAAVCSTILPIDTLTITPSSARVRKTSTVTLTWGAPQHGQNCTVSGKSVDGTMGPYSSSPATSGAINHQTVFTLSCNGVEGLSGNVYAVDKKTVNVVPTVQEI